MYERRRIGFIVHNSAFKLGLADCQSAIRQIANLRYSFAGVDAGAPRYWRIFRFGAALRLGVESGFNIQHSTSNAEGLKSS
jgi:hypothetical protein